MSGEPRAAPPGDVAPALEDVAGLGLYFAIATGPADEEPQPPGEPGDVVVIRYEGPKESPPPDEGARPAGEGARPGGEESWPVGEGWRPVREGYAEGLGPLVEHHAAYLGISELRVAASIAQLGLAARLWSPVLGCALLHGIVPDLRGAWRRPQGTELMLPESAGFVAPEGDELTRLVYDVVVRDHLEPLAAGLRVKLAPGLLRGNAASALAGSAKLLLQARPSVRDPLTRLASDLLNLGDLRGSGRFTGPGLTFRRNSCCLYYRVPGGGLCGDCSLSPTRRP